jgi:hypothetical protein
MARFTLFAVLAMIPWSASSAHDWYPWYCCSGIDCRQLQPGELRRGRWGWLTPSGVLVPFGDPRLKVTPREHPGVHLCERPDGSVICLYVPETED